MPSLRRTLNWKELGGLLALMAGVILLWETPVVYPLKVLVVFFHELSHAAVGLMTGASRVTIHIVPEEGGVTEMSGGRPFWVLSAGYLGSLLIGGAILLGASRTPYDRELSSAMGLLLLVATAVYLRPIGSFGFLFGALVGAAMLAAAFKLPIAANDFMLKLIGLTSCLYAVLDIKSDILDRPGIQSDARMLADVTGIPTLFWGILWIVIAVTAGLTFLIRACFSKRPDRVRTFGEP